MTLNSSGSAVVETAAHDLGTGTHTVMQQVAVDTLGLPPDRVTVKLGDTRFPASHGAIGSSTMSNAGGGSVLLAAKAVCNKAIDLALNGRSAPFGGAAADDVLVGNGAFALPTKGPRIEFGELLAHNGLSTLVADGDYDPAVSVAPAIASAVYHATGKRVRRLPISVENLR